MSRLSLVPPHLMDMPFVNNTRLPPAGVGYSDPLALSVEMPVYNAFFETWTGQNDGPEQGHDPNLSWDFDNYYDDETFWGVGIGGDGGSLQIEKKVISASGQLVSAGTYNVAVGNGQTWPQGQWTSGAGTNTASTYWAPWTNYRCVMQRADKNRLAVFFACYYQSNYAYVVVTLDISSGTPLRSSAHINTSMQRDGGGTPVLAGPDFIKVTDYLFFGITGDSSGQIPYAYLHGFNLKTNRSSAFQSFTYSASSQYWPAILNHRIGPRRSVFLGRGTANAASLLNDLVFGGNDDDNAAPTVTSAGTVTPGPDQDGGDNYHVRTSVFLTPTLYVQYNSSNSTIGLYAYSPGTTSQLSSISVRPTIPTGYPVVGIARLNNREFLIVYPDPADANRVKHRTQRVAVNADNTMTLGFSVQNYMSNPFATTPAGMVPHTKPNNRGTVLPGNRVLMQHRRRNAGGNSESDYQGQVFTKLLRAA